MSKEIAQTIQEQLRWGDYLRPARWAARDWVFFGEQEKGIFSDDRKIKVQGGLSFKVSGTNNIKRSGYVTIGLKWDDTYYVEIVKIHGSKVTPIAFHEEVYCDNLGEIIDMDLDG